MFYRSARRPLGGALPTGAARTLFTALYVLYPLGCALQLGPDNAGQRVLSIAGLLLVAAALIIFAVLAGSSLQRQAQEPEAKLDERELMQRNRAAYRAFSVFGAIVLIALIYMQLSFDFADRIALWTPTSPEHWNALFWGALILALTLPAAFLAWEREPPAAE